jgi:hypothetical protein
MRTRGPPGVVADLDKEERSTAPSARTCSAAISATSPAAATSLLRVECGHALRVDPVTPDGQNQQLAPRCPVSTSISLPPGSVETAALRQEQAPAPVSVSWLRVVQQTHRVLAHDGIPAIELTIWRSRWPGCSPRRSSSCGGRGTIPFDGKQSSRADPAGDRFPRPAAARRAIGLATKRSCTDRQLLATEAKREAAT